MQQIVRQNHESGPESLRTVRVPRVTWKETTVSFIRKVLDFTLSIVSGEIRHPLFLLFGKSTRGLIVRRIAEVLYLVTTRSRRYNGVMYSCVWMYRAGEVHGFLDAAQNGIDSASTTPLL
jgi:hypothetical protein